MDTETTISFPHTADVLSNLQDQHYPIRQLQNMYRHIRFTEEAASKVAAIWGIITGFHYAGQVNKAERMAKELHRLFSSPYIVGRGATNSEVKQPDGTVQRSYEGFTQVSVDRCLFSFDFARYVRVDADTVRQGTVLAQNNLHSDPCQNKWVTARYQWSDNGGMIFRGREFLSLPDTHASRSMSVDELWSQHT